MKQLRKIAFTVRTTKRIPSVNQMYRAKVTRVGGKSIAQVYTASEAKNWKQEVYNALRTIDFEGEAPWIFEKDQRFTLKLTFLIGSALNSSDVDNRIKATQDCLFKRLHMNDARILRVEAQKRLVQGASHETVCFELIENQEDPIFNNLEPLPRPLHIFLGGTCAGPDWRPEVIEWLKADCRHYEEGLYNPVVPDWTPDCVEAENKFKADRMDCFFAIITPSMKGVYSIAEIVSEAYQVKEQGYGSVLLGILGTQEEYGEGLWRSLMATKDLINRVSSGSKHIIAECIGTPVDLCKFLDEKGWKGRRKPKN